jgi:hypothetical protein
MLTKSLIAAGFVLLFLVGGEYIIRRDRTRAAERDALERDGIPTTGTVSALAKVSQGKYGQYRWRAEVTYRVGDTEHTVVESWAPDELPGLAEGAMFPMHYAPDDSARAMVIGTAAPKVPSPWTYRGLTLAVLVACVLAIVVL